MKYKKIKKDSLVLSGFKRSLSTTLILLFTFTIAIAPSFHPTCIRPSLNPFLNPEVSTSNKVLLVFLFHNLCLKYSQFFYCFFESLFFFAKTEADNLIIFCTFIKRRNRDGCNAKIFGKSYCKIFVTFIA